MRKVLIISTKIDFPIDNANKSTVFNLVSSLENVKFTVMTTKNAEKSMFNGNKNVVQDRIYPPSKNHMSFMQKICLFIRLCKKDDDIDIYHCMLEPSLFTIQILKFFISLKRKKSVITLLNKIEQPEILNQLRFFDRIVVSSEHMKGILAKMDFKNVARIYPGVDLNKFHQKNKDTDSFWRNKLGIGQSPVVLFAGNYNPLHGIYDIEQAIPEIIDQVPDVKIIFACRSYYKSQFMEGQKFIQRIKNSPFSASVIFLETVENIKELLAITDVLLFPMHKVEKKSDIPIILIEALAVKIPIVITNIPPLNEIMKEKVGHFIPIGDSKSIAASTIELLTDANQKEDLGRRGREMVERFFNSELMARQYFEIYKEMR
ncbi:MAG: glycosyltransferase family 4 protein [Candidatus Zixiibacteriota bacterium]